MGWRGLAEEPIAAERFAFGQAAAAAAAACRAARRPPLFSLTPCLPFWSSRPYSPPRNPQMLALLRLPRPPLARSSRVPPSPLRPPPARLAALPATVPGWVGPLSGGGGVRVLDLPLPPTGMLAALGLAIRRPSPPSPPFAPDRSLSPPFAARAVLHAFMQSRASGHGLCAPSPLMGIASVTSQITDHRSPRSPSFCAGVGGPAFWWWWCAGPRPAPPPHWYACRPWAGHQAPLASLPALCARPLPEPALCRPGGIACFHTVQS